MSTSTTNKEKQNDHTNRIDLNSNISRLPDWYDSWHDLERSVTMKPEIKTQLLLIIKSDLVTKHQGRLRSPTKENCFCVNGLICNIFDPSAWTMDRHGIWWYADTNSATLSDRVKEWAGLEELEGRLISSNDNYEESWDAVIEVLEAMWAISN